VVIQYLKQHTWIHVFLIACSTLFHYSSKIFHKNFLKQFFFTPRIFFHHICWYTNIVLSTYYVHQHTWLTQHNCLNNTYQLIKDVFNISICYIALYHVHQVRVCVCACMRACVRSMHEVYMQMLHSCTRWQRPIGCLKMQIIFHKRASNHRALLRKMTYKDKASYGSSPPCNDVLENKLILATAPATRRCYGAAL